LVAFLLPASTAGIQSFDEHPVKLIQYVRIVSFFEFTAGSREPEHLLEVRSCSAVVETRTLNSVPADLDPRRFLSCLTTLVTLILFLGQATNRRDELDAQGVEKRNFRKKPREDKVKNRTTGNTARPELRPKSLRNPLEHELRHCLTALLSGNFGQIITPGSRVELHALYPGLLFIFLLVFLRLGGRFGLLSRLRHHYLLVYQTCVTTSTFINLKTTNNRGLCL